MTHLKVVPTMAESHARDYADKRRMDRSADAIEAFLKDPPSNCHPSTAQMLKLASEGLRKDSARIVQRFD